MERCVNWMAFAATAQTTPLERCVKFHLHQMAIATHISITSTLALMGVIAVKVLAEALPRIPCGKSGQGYIDIGYPSCVRASNKWELSRDPIYGVSVRQDPVLPLR